MPSLFITTIDLDRDLFNSIASDGEVIVLDSTEKIQEQITEALQGYTNITDLHIVLEDSDRLKTDLDRLESLKRKYVAPLQLRDTFAKDSKIFFHAFNYQTFTRSFGNVSAGDEYVLGFGVVDVDGTDRSSALLLDNVEAVPFEFSPSLGLILVAGMFGCDRLRRRLKSKSEIESI
jgi:hypothetical protein